LEVIRKIQDIKTKIKEWKDEGKSIGFVPTMGFLHRGHASLIEKAASENDKVIVSIFVNPMQFDNCNDLDSYPSDLLSDIELATISGGDLIFNPIAQEIYPKGFISHVEVANLDNELCGATRPGHFRGVCTILTKFFLILAPHKAYFGEKDGLAMSSRNAKLSKEEKAKALIINQTLNTIKNKVIQGEREVTDLKKWAIEKIQDIDGAVVDYFEIVHTDTLQKIEKIENKAVVATAVFIGKTRLIDNMTLGGKDETTNA